MFDKIIALSIRNKVTIGAMTLALVVWGVWSATRLPIDAVPDITNNQVQVITQAPSLGAQEVEQFITAPIELALSNIPNVIEKRSISRSGISVITVVFKDATDIYWARQQVGERLPEDPLLQPSGASKKQKLKSPQVSATSRSPQLQRAWVRFTTMLFTLSRDSRTNFPPPTSARCKIGLSAPNLPGQKAWRKLAAGAVL